MNISSLRVISVVACALLFFGATHGARASTIVVEPDNFPYLTVLNNAVPGVTLSLSDSNGVVRPEFDIVSLNQFGLPSTGEFYFGANSSSGTGALFFYSSANLRADFDSLMQSVSIDIIGCCNDPNFPTAKGMLRAYDSSGNLLDTYITAELSRAAIETATVSTTGAEIAYVLAGTIQNVNFVHLDNFLASNVPIPAAFWLFGSALGLLVWTGRQGTGRTTREVVTQAVKQRRYSNRAES